MKNSLINPIYALALGMAFTACQTGVTETKRPSMDEYAPEKQRIKDAATTQEELESGVASLQAKYGINPVLILGENVPGDGKHACDTCVHAKPALPKSATVTEYAVFGVKSATANIERPYFEPFWVNAGQSVTATVTATSSGVDPFVVIYQPVTASGENMWDPLNQQKLDVLAWNDDYSGLNSRAVTGTFSTSGYVFILAFAYDAYSKGQANATIQVGSTVDTRNGIWIKGTALFHDNYSGTMIDKNGQDVDPYAAGWTKYLNGTTAFMATNVDFGPDYTFGSKHPSCSGDSYVWAFNMNGLRGMANDDTVDGYCSNFINDATWTIFPDQYHYPSFVLLGGYSDGGSMNFLQMAAFQR